MIVYPKYDGYSMLIRKSSFSPTENFVLLQLVWLSKAMNERGCGLIPTAMNLYNVNLYRFNYAHSLGHYGALIFTFA